MTRTQLSRNGLSQWRQLAVHRRGAALIFIARAAPAEHTKAGRPYRLAVPMQKASHAPTIRIGEFVISPEGDPSILGHPQIRY